MEERTLLDFQRELDALATIRGELVLKATRGRVELRDRLRRLDRKWQVAETDYMHLQAYAERDLSLVRRELSMLLADMKRDYEAIRHSLQTS